MNDERVLADAAARAASEECGCAPSTAESRGLWNSAVSRRAAIGIGALGVVSLSAFGIGTDFGVAHAAQYPDWEDVVRAKRNEATKAAEITRIQGLIAGLQRKVASTQAAAERAANEFYEAQQAFFDAATVAEELQAQADAQEELAASSARKAGQVATQLYRNGGDDTALELFFSGSAATADQLLSKLGTMDKLFDYNQSAYDDAVSARDSAQQLSDQAEVARQKRDELQQVAEQKMVAAQAAADAAQAALDEQSQYLTTLEAQLAALKETTTKTVAEYEKGVAERKRREEERRRREEERRRQEEERRRKEEEEAAKNNPGGGGGGGGGGGSGGGGSGGGSGWVRPHGGRRSSGYGRRPSRCDNYGNCSSSFHRGVDFANGCGAAIYAAHSGRVDYAGYNGGYGYYIRIQHGSGIATGYAHIRRGGFAVGHGQHVRAGQVIAYAGNTGNSLGCHLHFEVYRNGVPINPSPFMADRGVYF